MENEFSQMVDNSQKIIDAFNKQVELGLKAIGLTAEKYAKGDCPVDTGRLRNSITFATTNYHSSGKEPASVGDFEAKVKPESASVYIGTNVEYAPYVEFNEKARHDPPEFGGGKAHFLRDAAATHGDEYKVLMEEALKKIKFFVKTY